MKVTSVDRHALQGCAALAGLTATVFLTASVLAGAKGSDMKVAGTVEPPALIAVRIRHDMCPFCKELDPKFPRIVREFNDASVLFVTLDLTTEASQNQAALLLGALRLEGVWTGDLSKVGSVTLVDGPTRKILAFVERADVERVRKALSVAAREQLRRPS